MDGRNHGLVSIAPAKSMMWDTSSSTWLYQPAIPSLKRRVLSGFMYTQRHSMKLVFIKCQNAAPKAVKTQYILQFVWPLEDSGVHITRATLSFAPSQWHEQAEWTPAPLHCMMRQETANLNGLFMSVNVFIEPSHMRSDHSETISSLNSTPSSTPRTTCQYH